MTLEELGYNTRFEQFRISNDLAGFEIGRVVAEHKERYIVKSDKGEHEAEITGHMRYTAQSREEFPAVGDWVAISTYDKDFAIIHNILPRNSIIKRQAVAQYGEVQIIGTNIDYAFLVQAVDRDFNINRLERYLTICNSSNVSPIIVLTKTDLIDAAQLAEIVESIKLRIDGIPILAISNATQQGYDALNKVLEKGKTYCMLGSSGVGKSTLLNNLSGRAIMKTDTISESSNKGKHVTSHRELIVLEHGGILIDNPGMREVGIADTTGGLEKTFDKIVELSKKCKFNDCTHLSEIGCAILKAVERGEIDAASYENFLKMQREKAYFESTLAERRKRDKQFGKIMKNFKKDMKKNNDQL
jgi:ribosome biogenesis GTPase